MRPSPRRSGVPGMEQRGIRSGNWLAREQPNALVHAGSKDAGRQAGPCHPGTASGLWPAACGADTGERLRRAAARRPVDSTEHARQGESAADRTRSCVGQARHRSLDQDPGILRGRLLRPVDKSGKIVHKELKDEKAMYRVMLRSARQTTLGKLAPHDLRRTCAKLCRKSGELPEQIQQLLGHRSVQTTDRYLCTQQNLSRAANDFTAAGADSVAWWPLLENRM